MKTETLAVPDLPHEDGAGVTWYKARPAIHSRSWSWRERDQSRLSSCPTAAHTAQVIEPVLQQVAAMVKSNEKIFRVNIAVEPELAERYQIQGTPTMIMFLDGTEVGRVEGPSPKFRHLLTAIRQPYES